MRNLTVYLVVVVFTKYIVLQTKMNFSSRRNSEGKRLAMMHKVNNTVKRVSNYTG